MVRVHAFFALLAGFVTMAAIVVVMMALLKRVAPEWTEPAQRPRPLYVFVNLGYSFLAGSAGGYVTSWAAGTNALANMLVLGVIVLVVGAISALQTRGQQPAWYQIAMIVVAPLGVVAGGLVRLRVVGIL